MGGGSERRGGRAWQLGCHICVRGRGSRGVSRRVRGHSLLQLHVRAPLLPVSYLFPLLSISPLVSSLFSRRHTLSYLARCTLPLCGSPQPSSLKAERRDRKRERERARGESEGRQTGQTGSQLSVRPFITYLWLCAHLHCRPRIQNYYYCFAYCCVWCHHNQ